MSEAVQKKASASDPLAVVRAKVGGQILYGGDYNPEQWPRAVWDEDMVLMREAGVNLVTVGVFAWGSLEPEPGRYTFSWMEELLDLLHRNGIAVDLATPTAAPPPWLGRLYPETLPVDRHGVRHWYGGRRHYCPSSPAYREASERLVVRLAETFGRHPAVALWHVDNEYGGVCYCDQSAKAFRAWLHARYGSIDALNDAWGATFWGQRYRDWDEIEPPREHGASPAQEIDFQRFTSDAFLELFVRQRDLLRARSEAPVTTNFMGFFKPLDYWRWAAAEDIVSHDLYPDPAEPDAPVTAAATHDLVRSLAGGRPWLLMEQTPSRVNWRPVNVAKRPGQMRLWSYQALARGADGLLFFQWRASRFGAEKFHGGMVPHAGTAARSWEAVRTLGRELPKLRALAGSVVSSPVALTFDWENWWALELPNKPRALRLLELLRPLYASLYRRHVPVDFVRLAGNWDGHRVLLVPHQYMLEEPEARRLEAFVRSGGTAVVWFFSAIVDRNDQVHRGPYPAPLRALLGLAVEDVYPLADGEQVTLTSDGTWLQGQGTLWCDGIEPEGAEVVAIFEDGPCAGRPAVTRRPFGEGTAWYVGTALDARTLDALWAQIGLDGRPEEVPAVPDGVEVVVRRAAGIRYVFLLNHGEASTTVPLTRPGYELVGDKTVDTVALGPRDVAVVRFQESSPERRV